uniref:TIL domain-containing protein n=1 Tax=Ciona savignyi TaxID=51511 RepID=H2Z4K1_CIOSA
CPGNQHFSRCGGCNVPCIGRNIPRPCPRICKPGCVCPPGTYLNGDNCVKEENCPALDVCDADQGEVFSMCAPSCDATCLRPTIPCSLTKICTRRCACPPGTLRHNGACVEPSSCPVIPGA